ncbi:hypothetical protein [uncultured Bacteroides sp.]|uniref:hypothetical protein n=1 Tax=uncultured Bacteroides sp. TaxID=162156 RepID=UPI00261889B7|nr:hypothetical protein [uncultured Bacteroides sp.]
MELDELIENTLRRKLLEEMMDRPEKEHTPLEGMDNEQIKRFALFLFEENQNKSKQLDEMIARLDEIGKGCQHLHTGRRRTVSRIWTGLLLSRTC